MAAGRGGGAGQGGLVGHRDDKECILGPYSLVGETSKVR